MIQYGLKTVFGENMDCPPLPEGFKLVRNPNCQAIAVTPGGVEYLIVISPPARLVRIKYRKPPHTICCDFKYPIYL